MPAELQNNHENRLQNGSAPPLPLRSIMPQHGTNQQTTAATAESSSSVSSKSTSTTDRRDGVGGRADVTGGDGAATRRLLKRYRVEVAASASSVLSTLTTFPLDSVKTRMQTYKYAGFLDCVRHTYSTEKLRGFFRGEFYVF